MGGLARLPTQVVEQAARVLTGHHSASTLPRLARRLRLQEDTMAHSTSPWCDWCRRWCRKNAVLCDTCGWDVSNPSAAAGYQASASQPQQPPWSGISTWEAPGRPPSPRDRRPSPRRLPKPPKGKGKGKGDKSHKGAVQPPVGHGPELPAIPPPPKAPVLAAIATTTTTAPSETTASPAQARLDALISSLRNSREALPPEVVNLLGESEVVESNMRSKALHKAVNAEATAKKQLHRVQNARRAYLTSWTAYIGQLQELLRKQMEEQEKVLGDFKLHEDRWQAQLLDAKKTLAALSDEKALPLTVDGAPTAVTLSSSSDMEAEDSDGHPNSRQDPWADLAVMQAKSMKESQLELANALNKARAKAESAAKDAKRDISRSPRRHKEQDGAGGKDNKDAKEEPAEVHPPNALT